MLFLACIALVDCNLFIVIGIGSSSKKIRQLLTTTQNSKANGWCLTEADPKLPKVNTEDSLKRDSLKLDASTSRVSGIGSTVVSQLSLLRKFQCTSSKQNQSTCHLAFARVRRALLIWVSGFGQNPSELARSSDVLARTLPPGHAS